MHRSKEAYLEYLKNKTPEGSGKAASYAKAMGILESALFKDSVVRGVDIWRFLNPDNIQSLYDYVLEEQKKADGIFRGIVPASYWEGGYCSAALAEYKAYLDQGKIEIRPARNVLAPALFHDSIRFFPKPFLILAGPSGTGKSRWVRQQAFLTWAGSEKPVPPANYLLVPVKPNWHDSSELLGYVTRLGLAEGRKARYVVTEFVKFIVRAWRAPHSPHWLCLDEMNLAPVEQYFAEYLSVIETRRLDRETGTVATDPIVSAAAFVDLLGEDGADSQEWSDFCRDVGLGADPADKDLAARFRIHGISLPQNLIVVGTVNMDETTHSFSRKVLDRAFVWEMPIGDLDEGWDPLKYPEVTPPEWVPLLATGGNEAREMLQEGDALPEAWLETTDTTKAVVSWLKRVNGVLEGTPFQVSYRVRDELLLLALARGVTTVEALQQTLDDGLYSKILPRIEGDVVRTQKALAGLGKLLLDLAGLAEAPEWMQIFSADPGQELDFQRLSKAPGGPAFMFGSETWPSDPFAPAMPWRRSLNKIRSMLLKLEGQFTSYWD